MEIELSTVEIKPKATHRYSVIWLHGLGGDGYSFKGIAEELNLKNRANIHFIFPHAPLQPLSINNSIKMRAWHDIVQIQGEPRADIDSIYQSAFLIKQLIQKEINSGIASRHILLAGFSQGGALALHTGLRFEQKLAGIVALSTYLPRQKQLKMEAAPENFKTPILIAHGRHDTVIEIEAAKTAHDVLSTMGYPLIWHDYNLEHTVCSEEIEDLSVFMNGIFV